MNALPWPIFSLPAEGPVASLAGGEAFGIMLPGNPLAGGPIVPQGQGRFVLWSGWMGEGADEAAGIFPATFETWSGRGRAALEDFLAQSRGAELAFRPHARHVLSDPTSCASFLARAPEGVGVLLDPAGFLTDPMLGRAEDHLGRAFEALAGRAGVAGLVLSNVERVPGGGDDALRAAPLEDGLLEPGVIVRLALRHWATGRAVLLPFQGDAEVIGRLVPTLVGPT